MRNRTHPDKLFTYSRADRRVSKTKRALHEALVSLIREREYEDISIQEILDRANVGRSTFYSHYEDKDELLVSGIHEMILSVPASSSTGTRPLDDLTWFGLPILEHHEYHRRGTQHRMTESARTVLHEHLRRVLAGLVRERVKKSPPSRRGTLQTPPELLVSYISTTFVLVLNWWLDSRSPMTAVEANEVFRSLVGSALGSR